MEIWKVDGVLLEIKVSTRFTPLECALGLRSYAFCAVYRRLECVYGTHTGTRRVKGWRKGLAIALSRRQRHDESALRLTGTVKPCLGLA
jgi:hypothetical protein